MGLLFPIYEKLKTSKPPTSNWLSSVGEIDRLSLPGASPAGHRPFLGSPYLATEDTWVCHGFLKIGHPEFQWILIIFPIFSH